MCRPVHVHFNYVTSVLSRSWSFKATLNVTEAPTTPADIQTNGVVVSLVTAAGTVLDEVAYEGTDCQAKALKDATRRIECRAKGRPGKLSLVYKRSKADKASIGSGSGSGAYTATGSWSKRALHGATAAAEAPLGVFIAVPGAAAFGSV